MSIDYSLFPFAKGQNTVKKQRKTDISKTTREQAKEQYKGKCALCGKPGTQQHHIEYRSEDKTKIDDVDNLVLLCVECHQKVHSNKKYWQPRLKKLKKNSK
jgi:5-methylcytosine-specific restriction endonuclease McrA